MGSWGTGLYQNDMAADVKMVFADLSRRPTDAATLAREVLERFDCAAGPEGEDGIDVWLAVADLLHQHGLEVPEVAAKARTLIEGGADARAKADLGMSDKDLAKRERAMSEVLARWAAPHPKPKKRKAAKAAEEFLLEPGEVWAYRTMAGAACPFHLKGLDLKRFEADGWGVFAVAKRWHHEGHRACFLFVLGMVEGADCPTLEAALAAPVQDMTFDMGTPGQRWTTPMIFEARLGKKKQGLKRWEAVRLGVVDFDAGRVRAAAPERLKQRYNANDPDGIAWLEDDVSVAGFHNRDKEARTGLSWRIAPHEGLRIGDFVA